MIKEPSTERMIGDFAPKLVELTDNGSRNEGHGTHG